MKIGTLFDFRILVRTERTCEGDMQALQNKFMVEGLDGIKYTYNNGYIAKTRNWPSQTSSMRWNAFPP